MNLKRKRKSGSNAGLIIGLSLGGVALFAVLGVALFLASGKKSVPSGGGEAGIGGEVGKLIDGDNAKVTRANYEAIHDGHTGRSYAVGIRLQPRPRRKLW